MLKLITLPFQFINYVNNTLAEAWTMLFEKRNIQDPNGIGRTLFHGATLITPPYILVWSNGYSMYPFDFYVWAPGLFWTAKAWNDVYRHNKQPDTFGSAKFAELAEMKKLKLVETDGIVFGKLGGHLITKSPALDGHVLVIGGSGLGKSKSVAIPTLMRWKGSAVVFDIKGELSQETSMYRPNRVYIFNPTKVDCHQYNPIDQVMNERDAAEMARILCPVPPQTKDPFWHTQAQRILKACILEGAHNKKTLSQIAKRMMLTPNEQLLEELLKSPYEKVRVIAGGAQLPENTLGGVMGQARDSVEVFATDDGIEQSTSRSDWTSADLEGEGATIYLSVPEHLLHTYSKLFAVIFNQINNHLTQREEKQDPPVLLLYDELYSLGTLPDFTQKLSTLRSRNVHAMLFIQSFAQLDERYGVHGRKMIDDNSRYQLVLQIQDIETAKTFTARSGTKTVQTMSKHKDKDDDVRLNEAGVPLIRVEEWRNLEKPILFPFKGDPIQIEQVWVSRDTKNPENDYMDPILFSLLEKDLKQMHKEIEAEQQTAKEVARDDQKVDTGLQ